MFSALAVVLISFLDDYRRYTSLHVPIVRYSPLQIKVERQCTSALEMPELMGSSKRTPGLDWPSGLAQ